MTLYQLHCRYAIEWGADMKKAAELWATMRDRYSTPEEHLSALEEHLQPKTRLQPPVVADIELSAIEGDPRMFFHVRRERDPALVEAKRREANANNGRMECEVCGFTTQAIFPSLEGEVCEIHHRLPLASSSDAVETRLEDLAVLCANCHRAIHRTDSLMSVEDFRARFYCGPTGIIER